MQIPTETYFTTYLERSLPNVAQAHFMLKVELSLAQLSLCYVTNCSIFRVEQLSSDQLWCNRFD